MRPVTEKPFENEEKIELFNLPGLEFKPGGSITISGDAKMILKIDDNEIELKNDY